MRSCVYTLEDNLKGHPQAPPTFCWKQGPHCPGTLPSDLDYLLVNPTCLTLLLTSPHLGLHVSTSVPSYFGGFLGSELRSSGFHDKGSLSESLSSHSSVFFESGKSETRFVLGLIEKIKS